MGGGQKKRIVGTPNESAVMPVWGGGGGNATSHKKKTETAEELSRKPGSEKVNKGYGLYERKVLEVRGEKRGGPHLQKERKPLKKQKKKKNPRERRRGEGSEQT